MGNENTRQKDRSRPADFLSAPSSSLQPAPRQHIGLGSGRIRPAETESMIQQEDVTLMPKNFESLSFKEALQMLVELQAHQVELEAHNEELRAREERLRLAQESAKLGIWDWTIETGALYFSPELNSLYGLPPNTIKTYQDWRERVHPDDIDGVEAGRTAALATHESFNLEFRIRHSSGEYRWILAKGGALYNQAGKALRMFGENYDITEAKQMRMKLRQSETLYRSIGEAIDYGVWVCDPDGRNTYASDSFLKMVGLTQKQCSDFGWGDVLHPEDAERTLAAWQECVRTGSSEWSFEHRFHGIDGHWHYVLARGVPIKNDQGEIICWAGINLDITDRKRAEQTLAESNQRFKVLAETMLQGVVHQDSDGKIIAMNPAAERILGKSKEQFLGSRSILEEHHTIREDGELFPAQDHPALVALRTGLPVRGVIMGVFNPILNGYRWISIDAVPVFSPGEILPSEVFAVFEDVTDREYYKKGLEEMVAKRTAEFVDAMEALVLSEKELRSNLVKIQQLKDQLEAEKSYLLDEIKLEHNYTKIIGQSDGLKYVLYKVEQIASSDTTVLILGETGTGKELAARAVHEMSRRKDRALVKVNCATLPANLIESELFGHEKGSFTGSHSRHLGRFEIANDGTFFLDEIGELPLELQGKLLRVIQDGEFERVGGSKTIKVNTRIIAATNRNLEEEVRQGRFRQDLWYRLNVFPITMPPLRDRADDIPLLVDFMVARIAKRMGKTIDIIPVCTMEALQQYHWPGNIRELENVLERAVINSSGPKLRLADDLKRPAHNLFVAPQETLAAVERNYILQVLEQTNWKVSGKNSAAEILGLDRSTLRARMSKLNIEKL